MSAVLYRDEFRIKSMSTTAIKNIALQAQSKQIEPRYKKKIKTKNNLRNSSVYHEYISSDYYRWWVDLCDTL